MKRVRGSGSVGMALLEKIKVHTFGLLVNMLISRKFEKLLLKRGWVGGSG